MWGVLLNEVVNLYAEEEMLAEGSIVPFLMFCLFFAGTIVVIYGAVNLFTEWRDFRIFYDAQALEEKPDIQLKKKKMKKYAIVIGVGVVLILASYL